MTKLNEQEIVESAKLHAQNMIEEYEENKFDKDYLNGGFDGDYVCIYYGSILDMSPSGKYYMPWCSNQTEEDVDNDALFWETLEDELDSVNLWYESGEGDGLDIMICGEYEGDESVDEEDD